MNLFGKVFYSTILMLIFTEALSLAGYLFPLLGAAAFFIILIAILILALIKPEYGLYILLTELFVGGYGHLFSFEIGGFSLSIRMAFFLIFFVIWLFNQIRNHELGINISKSTLLPTSYFLLPYLILALVIISGLINGWLHNHPSNAFLDANAWFYFALIFVFWDLIKNKKIITNIFQVLAGATVYLSLKTIAVLFLFSHNFAGIGGFFYKWLRDSGVGEITYISGTMFRIFFQSQLYCLIGFLIVLTFFIAGFQAKEWKKYIWPALYLYLASLAVIISQSRSFWVGGAAAIFGLLIFSWWQLGFRIKKTALLMIVLIIVFASQIYLIQLISGNFSSNIVADRFKNLPGDAAGISRLNQLRPLLSNISQKPLFGYGFGKQLTYQSNDPRILKAYPGGIYTTYAFEWGYLDIALKLGLIGLAVYVVLLATLFYQGIKKIISGNLQATSLPAGRQGYQLQAGLLLGFIALCVTNIFSPYLNHPLGIGYLILMTAIYGNHADQS